MPLTDDQAIDAAAILMTNTRLMDILLAREEIAELRRELRELRALVSDWAHLQYVPVSHKEGDDLLPWIRAERAASVRLMRAGGIEPRGASEVSEGE